MLFKDPSHVKASLEKAQYICSDEIATVVYLACATAKPVLVEGPAGVGKTELAKAVATGLQRELIRLQCYEGLDEAKALYEWEYAKQLLYTQIMKEKIHALIDDAATLTEAADRIAAQEDAFFSERFIQPRPLLKAISRRAKSCADGGIRSCPTITCRACLHTDPISRSDGQTSAHRPHRAHELIKVLA